MKLRWQARLKYALYSFYWKNIKHRGYTKRQKDILCSFESAVRARKEVDTLVYEMLNINIERAKCLFDDDAVRLETIESIISDTAKEWEARTKELEENDGVLWRIMFAEYVLNHTDEETIEVWKCPIEDVQKFRAILSKKV